MEEGYAAELSAIETYIAERVRERDLGYQGSDRYRRELTAEIDERTGDVQVTDYTIDTCREAPRERQSETDVLSQILSEEAPWVTNELFGLIKEVFAGVVMQAEWSPPTDEIALALVLLLGRAKNRADQCLDCGSLQGKSAALGWR